MCVCCGGGFGGGGGTEGRGSPPCTELKPLWTLVCNVPIGSGTPVRLPQAGPSVGFSISKVTD